MSVIKRQRLPLTQIIKSFLSCMMGHLLHRDDRNPKLACQSPSLNQWHLSVKGDKEQLLTLHLIDFLPWLPWFWWLHRICSLCSRRLSGSLLCDKRCHFNFYKDSISLFHVKKVVEPRTCSTACQTRENMERLHHIVILCEIYLIKNRFCPFMKQ